MTPKKSAKEDQVNGIFIDQKSILGSPTEL